MSPPNCIDLDDLQNTNRFEVKIVDGREFNPYFFNVSTHTTTRQMREGVRTLLGFAGQLIDKLLPES